MKNKKGLAALLASGVLHALSSNAAHAAQSKSVEQPLACDATLASRFRPDEQTRVVLVKPFSKGAPLVLGGGDQQSGPAQGDGSSQTAPPRVAQADLCLVKLVVGPGNPGPADAPSTSEGIGIEIWLPTPAHWNRRIHVQGGGGWAGGGQGSLAHIDDQGIAGGSADIAALEGAVSATTDTGHSMRKEGNLNLAGGNGSFAMLPDGEINVALWRDFAERSLHEMAVKTKALARAYYGKPALYAYWDGFSTGGRQGLKEAQAHPDDFDGILVGAPAINWTRFITTELYPQIVMQRDLGGKHLTAAQLAFVSNAAIKACDVVGGVHLGYISDPANCRYDPATDRAVLCASAGGTGPEPGCLTTVEAQAFNKIWYGLTRDGTAPDPNVDNGFGIFPRGNQRWFALTRGTELRALAGETPFTIASDLVALELGDPKVASTGFVNAVSNGENGWKTLSYEDLNRAFDRGVELQDQFADINTDRADLYAFRDHGGKMLMYHGLADVLIPSQGSLNYYNRVLHEMGGGQSVQKFFRFYLVPGMSHAFANGTANPDAILPLPDHDELYARLTRWVEHGEAPGRYDIAAKSDPGVTAALCVYPQSPKFTGKSPLQAESYTCQ
ncbi:tannase/feruloyl esterase family alpha/beta hydrolase [Novosphingobium profundi]|uniref:tannase/feruloyl esterase family alpha/beta hydrolase n=1 Tax=Novosphingobium profundi TaxID=1774954 RepID=UPI001BD9A125|nr:tannase/feruloyl esterase family alpha/beta hydrolase [Novosphingobium profundi]MBT0667319.1 tannase/feruloyl esterase family alpha/beta hydrolase [Novosphingobium profundi]